MNRTVNCLSLRFIKPNYGTLPSVFYFVCFFLLIITFPGFLAPPLFPPPPAA